MNFIKPDKVVLISSDQYHGKFEFRPLEPGFGLTIGNALRRVLYSSLEGYAITSFRIEGVEHEFSTIDGVVEDVTEIVLNLKQIRFKNHVPDNKSETITAKIVGITQLTAGELGKYISCFQVLNPDLVICNMNPDVKLDISFTIQKGRGYVPAEANKPAHAPMGTIAIDSIFTPIKKVNYIIEDFRVDQKTDYEKLIIEITTDGSIHPQEALTEAA
ncbi:MAG: DNA-directed RNA polymerase subunit alpha, partial [Candidatus Jordarchaeaceae archaeon]